MSDEKLKPCPFCGSDGRVLKNGDGKYWVTCERSCAKFPIHPDAFFNTVGAAVESWNTRHQDAEAKAYKQGAAHDSKIIHEQEETIRRYREALEKMAHRGPLLDSAHAYNMRDEAAEALDQLIAECGEDNIE